jgi:hypothetical protein
MTAAALCVGEEDVFPSLPTQGPARGEALPDKKHAAVAEVELQKKEHVHA